MSGMNVGSVFFRITSNRGAFTGEMKSTASATQSAFKAASESVKSSFKRAFNETVNSGSKAQQSLASQAAKLAAEYRKQGLSQSEAFTKAWGEIERSSGNSGKKAGKKFSSNFEKPVLSSFKNIARYIATAFSLRAIINFGKACVQTAKESQNAWQGLSSILNGQGKSFDRANSFIKSYIKDGLVPLNNAVTAYKNLASRGYDTSQIESVMNALKDSAAYGRAASYSYGDAIQTATEGLKNENSILVDNAGVTKNVAKMWEDYAKSIGTAAQKLTKQQRIQAEVNGILEETKWQMGDAAKYSSSFAGRLARLSATFTSVKTNIGNLIIPIANVFIPIIQKALDLVNNFALSMKSVFSSLGFEMFDVSALGNATSSAIETATAITNTGSAAEKAAKKIKKSFASFDEINVLSKSSSDSSGSDASISTGGSLGGAAGSSIPDTDEEGVKKTSRIAEVLKGTLISVSKVINKVVKPAWNWLNKNVFNPLKSFAVDTFISAMETVNQRLSDFADLVSGDLSLSDFINNLSGVEIALSSVATAIGAVKAALVSFNIVTKIISAIPIKAVLITAVIAGIIAAIVLCVKHWDRIKEAATNAWDKIKEKWQGVSEWFSEKFTKAKEAITNVFAPIKTFFSYTWDNIKKSLSPLIEEIKGAFSEAWEVVKLVWNYVKPFFASIWDGIKGVFSVVKATLGGFFSSAWEYIKLIWSVAGSYFSTIWENIKLVFSVVGTFFEGAFNTAWTAVKAIWNNAVNFFTLVWAGIKAIFSVAKGILSGNFTDAWNAIKNVWDKVKNYFSGVWIGVKDVFKSVGTWFGDTFKAAWTAVKKAFTNWGDFFKGLWDSIKETFSKIGTNIATAIGSAVKSGINAVISSIEDTINGGIGLINGAIRLINNVPGVNIGTIKDLELPRLAQGGWVAANNPQLAIIGDNTREGEIVTPESKIYEQVLKALKAMGGTISGAAQTVKLAIELVIRYPDGRTIIKQINEAQIQEGRILLEV